MITAENSVERDRGFCERHRRGLSECVKTARGHHWKKELCGSRIGEKIGVGLSIVALGLSQGIIQAVSQSQLDPKRKREILLYTTGAIGASLIVLEILMIARPTTRLISSIAVITTICHRWSGSPEVWLGAAWICGQLRIIERGYPRIENAVRACYARSDVAQIDLMRRRLPVSQDLPSPALNVSITQVRVKPRLESSPTA